MSHFEIDGGANRRDLKLFCQARIVRRDTQSMRIAGHAKVSSLSHHIICTWFGSRREVASLINFLCGSFVDCCITSEFNVYGVPTS